MGLLPQNVPVYVSVAAWSWGAYLGDDAGNKGVRVCISNWKRISPQSFKPYAKGVGGYMNSTLAKIDAVNSGYDDAIMLGDNDVVAEGKTVIEIAQLLSIPLEEKNITINDLKNADELFFTGTATEVVGVVSIDGEDIGNGTPGDLTNLIRDKYLKIVNGEDSDFHHYLTLVS